MKKLFTSLALLCASFLTMQAQNCFFQFKGQPLEDGATVTITAEEDPLFGDLVCDTNPPSDPDNGLFLVNKTSQDLNCLATINIQKNTIGASSIQWCMGKDCMPIKETSKSKDFKLSASSKLMTKFDCAVSKEGEMLTKLEVKTNDKTYTVNILFVNGESHVAGTTSASTPVAYYTLDGRQVSQRPHGLCLVKFSDGRVRKVCGK